MHFSLHRYQEQKGSALWSCTSSSAPLPSSSIPPSPQHCQSHSLETAKSKFCLDCQEVSKLYNPLQQLYQKGRSSPFHTPDNRQYKFISRVNTHFLLTPQSSLFSSPSIFPKPKVFHPEEVSKAMQCYHSPLISAKRKSVYFHTSHLYQLCYSSFSTCMFVFQKLKLTYPKYLWIHTHSDE